MNITTLSSLAIEYLQNKIVYKTIKELILSTNGDVHKAFEKFSDKYPGYGDIEGQSGPDSPSFDSNFYKNGFLRAWYPEHKFGKPDLVWSVWDIFVIVSSIEDVTLQYKLF